MTIILHSTRWTAIWLLLVFASWGWAEESVQREVGCAGAGRFVAGDSSAPSPQYAPDRDVDILHQVIDVTPDFGARSIEAITTIRFAPISRPVDELRLDAIDLDIESVESSQSIAEHQVTLDQLVVTFAEPIAPGAEASVTIRYSAEPEAGLYFRTPEMGYPATDTHLWTQGETHGAPHWYPSFDYPNERFTTEMICRVAEGMTVRSNGRLLDQNTDPVTGLVAHRWLQDKPHVNYLVALVAGRFEYIESMYQDVNLRFYTPPSQSEFAKNPFGDTAAMMQFFVEEIGVPFPWDKYDQVAVADFVAGGMENTSLTILTDRALYSDESENVYSGRIQNLVAHELAHQWFGDYVTCKDWSHLWLNEGFATYYAALYQEHAHGREAFQYVMHRARQNVLDQNKDERPIVMRRYRRPMDQFGTRAYQKGSWVLHMLRSQLGEELYRECITTYLERYAMGSVETEDLKGVIEEVSGRSMDPFFDQWVYHGKYPILAVKYEWLAKEKLAKVTVEQKQPANDKVLQFRFPLKIRFKGEGEAVDREVDVEEAKHDFYFPLDSAPETVRIDPDLELLAKINFTKPAPMLRAQLEDAEDAYGRMLAAEAMAAKPTKKNVALLKKTLKEDAFFGARIEASKALRKMNTDTSFEALAASMDQADARVRRQVVEDLAGFYEPDSIAMLIEAQRVEQNPAVAAEAIRGIGRSAIGDVSPTILDALDSDSYRQTLASAAIDAIRKQEQPRYVEPLRVAIAQRGADFPSEVLGKALGTLGYIARNEADKEATRSFLTEYLNHPKRSVQVAAIRALGNLRDPAAIAALETFEDIRAGDPKKRAAKATLKKLRKAQEVPVALGDLREEVAELKKQNKKTQEALDAMKAKAEAKTGGAESGTDAKKRKKWLGLF